MPDIPPSENRPGKVRAGNRDASAEIAAEIQDHLASAAEALGRRGTDQQQAQKLAAESFGNPQQIQRRCWWIRQGDQVMFRAVTVSLLSVLCVGLVVMGVGNWRLNSRLEVLTAALVDLSKKQSDAGDLAAKLLPEISGFCYLIDRSRPAVGQEVELLQFPDMHVLRRLPTDEQGRFRFGTLPAGDYCVTTPLSGSKNPRVNDKPFYWIQSQPLYVSEGATFDPVEFDVYFAHGSATAELKSPLPQTIQVGDRVANVGFRFVSQHQLTLTKLPWRPSDPLPPRWPAIGITSSDVWIGIRFNSVDAANGPQFSALPVPAGVYRVAACVGDDQLGWFNSSEGWSQGFWGGMGGGMGPGYFGMPVDVAQKGVLPKLKYWPMAPPKSAVTEVTIADGETVRLEVQFPADVAEQLNAAIVARDAKSAEHAKATPGREPVAIVYGRVTEVAREK